jgi:hypothetical protein
MSDPPSVREAILLTNGRERPLSRCHHARVSEGTAPRAIATDPSIVADQAGMVAAAWSPADAPASWRLTAAQFEVLRGERELLEIAATVRPDKLPALLFHAAATYLVLELKPEPLRSWFPHVGEPQPALDPRFGDAYRAFCLDHRDRLLDLCVRHRYQMNEVGRCAHVVAALADAARDGRDVALVDIGTGAGLGLHLDRYRYRYRQRDGGVITVGEHNGEVEIETEVRGGAPLEKLALPRVAERVGIDVEPLDVTDPDVRDWLAACVPQEIGAVTRFHQAVRVAMNHPARVVRADADTVLPALLDELPRDLLVCLVDTYVHVFFTDEELARFQAIVREAGVVRDLDWISIDPLVPLGSAASKSVLGVPVPSTLIERSRSEGVIGRLAYRSGERTAALLGVAHPGAAWLEWLSP